MIESNAVHMQQDTSCGARTRSLQRRSHLCECCAYYSIFLQFLLEPDIKRCTQRVFPTSAKTLAIAPIYNKVLQNLIYRTHMWNDQRLFSKVALFTLERLKVRKYFNICFKNINALPRERLFNHDHTSYFNNSSNSIKVIEAITDKNKKTEKTGFNGTEIRENRACTACTWEDENIYPRGDYKKCLFQKDFKYSLL